MPEDYSDLKRFDDLGEDEVIGKVIQLVQSIATVDFSEGDKRAAVACKLLEPFTYEWTSWSITLLKEGKYQRGLTLLRAQLDEINPDYPQ